MFDLLKVLKTLTSGLIAPACDALNDTALKEILTIGRDVFDGLDALGFVMSACDLGI